MKDGSERRGSCEMKITRNAEVMICDGSTCYREYVDAEQTLSYADEFVRSLRHEKCKVIQLIRRQIRSFHEAQHKLPPVPCPPDASKKRPPGDSYGTAQGSRMNEVTNAGTLGHLTGRSTPARPARLAHALRTVRQRICLIVSIAAIIMFGILLYGVYFRAYLCTSGQSCVTTVRYTHAKHTLF